MSRQQEMVMRSPIPRSRSDFSYVGLSPKEKRWTTDFSLLLPPFPRDNTGYSRLAESPVTHQPKPRLEEALLNSRGGPNSDGAPPRSEDDQQSVPNSSTRTNSNQPVPYMNRSSNGGLQTEPHSPTQINEEIKTGQNQVLRSQKLIYNSTKDGIEPTAPCRNQTPLQHHTSRPISGGFEPRTLGRSQTLDLHASRHISPISEGIEPRTIGRSQTAELVTSQSVIFNEGQRTVRKSPTLEPCDLKSSKMLYPTMELGPVSGSLPLTRIGTHALIANEASHPTPESFRSQRVNPFTTESYHRPTPEASRHLNCHSPMSEAVRHLNCHSSEAGRHVNCHSPMSEAGRHLSSKSTRHLTPEAGRHLMSIRKSPTMDSRTLRYSPLLSQHIISRSPTLDPGVLGRSPRSTRSPLVGRVTPEVVRSQSMRSLRKERSPAKIRSSESAQTDITCPIHRGFPLVEPEELDDFRRLRNFSVTNKGVVNWGDSFRSQSLTSVPSRSTSQWDVASTKSYPMTSSHSQWTCSHRTPQRYRVAIMGADEVGKTSLIRQFQTSEYICAFDTSYDINKEYAITVILNKEESELEFIEHRLSDESDEGGKEASSSLPACLPWADAYVVVYSVTSRRSFSRARELLANVRKVSRRSAVLLVGNKSDLVRVRAVTTDDGQGASKEEGQNCPFIETSAAINHQVDELLVAILTHIRATATSSSTSRWRHSSLTRAKGLIKKFLKKACFQSKSSDSLQRL